MNLRLVHIGDLIGMHFNILYYQHSYRWESKQVIDLLEDLLSFGISPKPISQFYCFHQLVVCRNKYLSDENFTVFDVMDCQQHLITIFLLLQYLGMESFELRYEPAIKREEYPYTWENGKLYYDNLKSISDEDIKSIPDYFYMKQVIISINDWFEEKRKLYPLIKRIFKNVLCNSNYMRGDKPFYEMGEDPNIEQNDVRFIWYEEDSLECGQTVTFNCQNYGKTPLTVQMILSIR